ncbi:hypothetical protein, partial [Paraglaciecola sp.]|uniref:hypothetical protein n=1 Tax=Paraglaciecola sp. TaxID=1920173 RepID=UPI00273F0138
INLVRRDEYKSEYHAIHTKDISIHTLNTETLNAKEKPNLKRAKKVSTQSSNQTLNLGHYLIIAKGCEH